MLHLSLLIIVISLLLIYADSKQTLALYMFGDEKSEPNAVCNDGSRGGYYFADAIDPSQQSVFVIYLPGGGQCYDEASCSQRYDTNTDLMTSKGYPSTRTLSGIMDSDPDHTPLWAANKAYLGYCSSDGYMGNVGASDDTWGFHFRGQSLIEAYINALLERHGMGNASTIHLVGSSAGARGAMTLLDKLVETKFPTSASVIGYLDSPYYLDVPPFSAQFEGFQYQEQQKHALFNTSGILSKDCIDAYPKDLWKCQFGQYRMPFVKTPYFLVASQYDSYQLSNDIQTNSPTYSDEAVLYAEDFAGADRSNVSILAQSVQDGEVMSGVGYGFFAWACYNHAVGASPLFYESYTEEGVSQKQAFEEYLEALMLSESRTSNHIAVSDGQADQSAGFTISWMDKCATFACGTGC